MQQPVVLSDGLLHLPDMLIDSGYTELPASPLTLASYSILQKFRNIRGYAAAESDLASATLAYRRSIRLVWHNMGTPATSDQ